MSKVEKGENAGRTLTHVQIVRGLYHFDIGSPVKSAVTVDLPSAYKDGDWEMIGFLQGTASGAIVGAARITF